jgi:hypothetical protein
LNTLCHCRGSVPGSILPGPTPNLGAAGSPVELVVPPPAPQSRSRVTRPRNHVRVSLTPWCHDDCEGLAVNLDLPGGAVVVSYMAIVDRHTGREPST